MLNKIQVIGRLGGDPEMRATAGGDQVANFSVAASERWKDKQGQQQEQTEWFKCVAWKRLAEICGQYLVKGSLVYIEGKIQTRKWQNQQGVDQYSTEVVVANMKMLDSKQADPRAAQGGQQNQGQPQGQPQQRPAQGQPAPQAPPHDDFSDDIPF